MFALGILSLVLAPICVGLLLGPIAYAKGDNLLREIDSRPGECTNRRRVVIGRRCGIAATTILIVGLIAVVLWAATLTSCSTDSASC